MEKECCCHKTKERDAKEYKDLCNRLSRIEGQIRGIKGMVEKRRIATDRLRPAAGMPTAFRRGMRASIILSFGLQCIL